MPIFSTLRNLVRRHKRKLIISTSIISVLYILKRFISYKLSEYQKAISEEKFAREQIRRRFEQTQKDSIFTILSLVPVLSKPINELLPVEVITQTLKNKKNKNLTESTNLSLLSTSDDETSVEIYNKKSKIELWSDLKIKSITRLLTLIYSISLLILLTRLQLNILARRSYLETALNLATNKKIVDNNEEYFSEQSYLSLSWWLLNKGLVQLIEIIETRVEQVFHNINVRTELSIFEFNELIWKVVELINEDFGQLIYCTFPMNMDLQILTLDNTNPEFISNLYNSDSTLKILINETTRYVESESFQIVLSKLIGNGLQTMSINLNNQLNSHSRYKLASILAQVTIQSSIIVTNDPISDYLNNMDDIPELDELSASVYSNFDDF